MRMIYEAMDRIPPGVWNAAAIAGGVGALAGVILVPAGLIINGDPLGAIKRTPTVAGNLFNVCDSLDEGQHNAVRTAMQEGRDKPFSKRATQLDAAGLEEKALIGVLDAPNLDYAKTLLNKATSEGYGFETTFGDGTSNSKQLKEDIETFTRTLVQIPPALTRAANLESVELNSDQLADTESGLYDSYDEEITLRPGKAAETFPHELGHALVAASVDRHCWLPSKDDNEFEAVNPPDFDYDEDNEYLPHDELRKVTLTNYGSTRSSDDAAETLMIIQNADSQAYTDSLSYADRACVVGRSPVTDEKLIIAMTRIEELVPGMGQEYARSLGSNSTMAPCVLPK